VCQHGGHPSDEREPFLLLLDRLQPDVARHRPLEEKPHGPEESQDGADDPPHPRGPGRDEIRLRRVEDQTQHFFRAVGAVEGEIEFPGGDSRAEQDRPARGGTGMPVPHLLAGQGRPDPRRVCVKQDRPVPGGNERVGDDAVREDLPHLLPVAAEPPQGVFRGCGKRQGGAFQRFRRKGSGDRRILMRHVYQGGGENGQQHKQTRPEGEEVSHGFHATACSNVVTSSWTI